MNIKQKRMETKVTPVGLTGDLQLVRHATCDIWRYCKILRDIFNLNLISHRIEKISNHFEIK
jgi:hypothetical protein